MPAPPPSRRHPNPRNPFSPQGRGLSQPTPQVTTPSQPRCECSLSGSLPLRPIPHFFRAARATGSARRTPAGAVTPTPLVPQILTLFNTTSHSLTLFFFPHMRFTENPTTNTRR
jgi:hypothetical protein